MDTPNLLPDDLSIVDLIELDNIADILSDEDLRLIGSDVVTLYDLDEGSRKEWLVRYEQNLELALQVRKEKTWPWPKASNVKVPLMTIGALTFHARAYPSLVPSRELVNVKNLGPDPQGIKSRRASRIKTHMNYQFLDEMTEWDEDTDRLLFLIPITGTEFKKVYYNHSEERSVSQHVFAKDLVVDYFSTKLENIRKTHILSMMPNEIKEYVNLGLYLDCNLNERVANTREDQTTHVSDKVQGLNKPSVSIGPQPRVILEQHTYLDLDGDDYFEPYIITVDRDTKKVLRIVTRFKKDNVIRNKTNIIKIIPDEYFIKYSFIPSPDGGFYDIGFGHLLAPVNEATNSLINQLIDSGTLNNMQSGFITKSFRQKGGSTSFELGEWKIVNATGQDIRQGIVPLPTQAPSTVLFSLLEFLVRFAQQISSTTDIMVGENPGQNQKATTTMQVVENGMRVFTSIYKRLRRSLTKEILKVYALNKDHLDTKTYLAITGADGVQDSFATVLEDYNDEDMAVLPTADANAVSPMQKVMKAEMLLKLLPLGVPAAAVLKRIYDAYDIENPEELMPQPSPPPPEVVELQHEIEQDAAELKLDEAEFEQKVQIQNREQERKEAETMHKIQHDQATLMSDRIDDHNKTQVAVIGQVIKDHSDRRKLNAKPNKGGS